MSRDIDGNNGGRVLSTILVDHIDDTLGCLYLSVGHKGKFGHEFLEFEFQPSGKLRYANNSNYKRDSMIRKEALANSIVLEELKRIVLDSEIMREDDKLWPVPDRDGRQELEIIYKGEHICFSVRYIHISDYADC